MEDYSFREIYERYNEEETKKFSSDSIYFPRFGKNIEELLPKFTTTSAKGRGCQKVNVKTADTSGNGAFFLSKKYEPLEIELNGYLRCSSAEELNKHIEAMQRWLQFDELQFNFHDDPKRYHVGTIAGYEVEEGTLSPKVTIKIKCSDPFLYGYDAYNYNMDGSALSWDDYFYFGVVNQNEEIEPEKLVIEYNLDSSVVSEGVVIKSFNPDGSEAHLIKTLPYSEFRSDNVMEIFTKGTEGHYCRVNGYWNDKVLDISSDISNFGLKDGGNIKIENQDINNAYYVLRSKDLG